MEISNAETVLANAEISIAALCRRVQIHPASWQNWKNGKAVPSMRNWESVQRELRKIKRQGRKCPRKPLMPQSIGTQREIVGECH